MAREVPTHDIAYLGPTWRLDQCLPSGEVQRDIPGRGSSMASGLVAHGSFEESGADSELEVWPR